MHPGIKPVSWHVIKSLQFFHKDTKQSSMSTSVYPSDLSDLVIPRERTAGNHPIQWAAASHSWKNSLQPEVGCDSRVTHKAWDLQCEVIPDDLGAKLISWNASLMRRSLPMYKRNCQTNKDNRVSTRYTQLKSLWPSQESLSIFATTCFFRTVPMSDWPLLHGTWSHRICTVPAMW